MTSENDINSFGDLYNVEHYDTSRQEASDFITDVLNTYNPDIVITVERKGRKLFYDLADSKTIGSISVLTDTSFTQSDVKGKRVLIFDDSMRSAESVVRAIDTIGMVKPAELRVSALMGNDEAISNLVEHGVSSDHIHLLQSFKTYDLQQKEYAKQTYSLVSGVRKKYGTDFPVLTFRSDSDSETVSHDIQEVLKTNGYDVDIVSNDVDVYRGTISITASVCGVCPHIGKYAFEMIKIRFSVYACEGGSEIRMEAIILPLDLDKMIEDCRDNKLKVLNRFCRITECTPTDDLCRKCMVLDTSVRCLRDAFDTIVKSSGMDCKIGEGCLSLPSRERYPAELLMDWDIYLRSNE